MEFPACDVDGREYARLSRLKAGDRIEADGGFTCMRPGAVLTVAADARGELYVPCDGPDDDPDPGKHFLCGQADDGDHLVGMYPVRG